MIPFTRNALWRKIEEDEHNSASSTTIGSLPWSSGALSSAPTPADPGSLNLTPPLDPAAPSPAPAPLSLPPIPNAVLEARDYMVSCTPATTGIMDMQEVVAQNIRLVEAARALGVWLKTINVQEDETRVMAKRITAKDIFGQVGSATGDEALALLKAKEDKKQAADAAAAEKRDATTEKRARSTTALVTAGSEVLKRLEQRGRAELLRLKIDELHALIVNADPLGSNSKPNKKTGLEKASLLPAVIAALERFSGSSSIATPAEAPPLLPIQEALLTCEGENIENNESDMPRVIYLPIFDPVFPYAPDAVEDAEMAI